MKRNYLYLFAAIVAACLVVSCMSSGERENKQLLERVKNSKLNSPSTDQNPVNQKQSTPLIINTTPSQSSGQMVKVTCSFCNGKGTRVSYKSPSYGNNKSFYCYECKRNVEAGHFHKTCPSCNGLGYTEKFKNY